MTPGRRRRPWWPAWCLLACTAPAAAALELQASAPLTQEEAVASQRLLDTAVDRLPPIWAQALDRRIAIQWRNDLPAHVHGRTRGRRVWLQRSLLEGWIARPSAADDDPATRAALAAVIHELAHVYDRSPHGGLSRDPRLLDLAGWQVAPLRPGLRTRRNAFSDRSPDRYELISPAEFVAVNLEHFLLDPEYACRRPALYRHFAAHFGHAPVRAECAPDLVYLQADDDPAQPLLLQLDPARVHAVDYLLAEGNERIMSRWGHSMLRLVICAPGRPPGPDCRLDLQHHRVLSFRAFVDDVQISNWRGLTGSYPSRLFLLPLEQVIEEYTGVELRGLKSIPLRLRPDEIATLLERAARLHWNYDGRYYFIGNNCAVETFKLLHDGVPRLADERLTSITPTGLLRRLRRSGIADVSVLEDGARALRLGYRFQPMSAHYQDMFDVAREALGLPYAQAVSWLELPPETRTPWLRHAGLRDGAALLLLEQAALRRQELLARDALKRRFFARRPAELQAEEVEAISTLQDLLHLEDLFTRPAMLLPEAGYGLPQQAERAALLKAGSRHVVQWRRQGAQLRTEARRWLPAQQRSALEQGEANLELLGQRLRELHREQGGMQLPSLPASPSPPSAPTDGSG